MNFSRLLAALASGTAALVPFQAWAADDPYRPFAPIEVSKEVHLLSTPDDFFGPAIGNIVVIEQSDGVVVVDSGTSIGHGRTAVRYIKSLTSKPVKAVVITHWHNDHPQGVAALKEAWPKIRVITTPGTKAGMLGPESESISLQPNPAMEKLMLDRINDAKTGYQKLLDAPDTAADRKVRIRRALGQFDDFYNDFKGSYLVAPTETFKSTLRLPDRKVPIELRFFGRANTEGDAVIWLPKQRIVATGDIVVSPVPFGFNSYPSDWLGVLAKVKALGFKTLIPGHGKPMNDATYVDKLIASITAIRDKIGAAVKSGMTFKQVKEKVDLSAEADRLTDVPRLKPGVVGNWTEPMTSNAYREAKGIPIKQNGNPEPDPE